MINKMISQKINYKMNINKTRRHIRATNRMVDNFTKKMADNFTNKKQNDRQLNKENGR